jgi:AraC-like DNA-binding protein
MSRPCSREKARRFSEFVRGQRLARAHQLFNDPHRLRAQIGEIAFEVGFSDLSHFNRDFRRRYGVTPSDVRAAAIRRHSSASQ